jgi:hypothetical protein
MPIREGRRFYAPSPSTGCWSSVRRCIARLCLQMGSGGGHIRWDLPPRHGEPRSGFLGRAETAEKAGAELVLCDSSLSPDQGAEPGGFGQNKRGTRTLAVFVVHRYTHQRLGP